ncbi:chemotaxis protein CheW [Clostridium cochlearium]|jgi:purine-binding chemotaxis protein CheW|uniref:Chemotaxis protein cheW n=1 Tax=Clostridium cochlearium TaxID=1494 RepID=A0A240AEG1_CLOCO|nr:chemotaxis protein CheW [Clostridium cochlearium]MBV1819351.1 chemotaxis protein CheW [Bacteroidales bacterium MSK.15.36]MBE6064856.1 purine-binding chemotaxis protein CheW [Clostridium cochlearium]MBU5269574.1 chemotaxis protein CheW [Clostridium cochlearium]MCG4571607.1 chemotaxis protein CheW [Clostridium cochlearium]MCG4580858.1 chemotaxis protein CheW [Clostridium cochlearium]
MQIVIFKLKDEQFAVETEKIESINDTMEITKVPNAPAYIKGLINLRGNIISLLDINLLLEAENHESEQENIIILKLEEELVGITVDNVDEVIDIKADMVEKVDEEGKKDYIKGVINFKDRIVTLIDIDKLLLNQ